MSPSVISRALQSMLLAMLVFTSGCRWWSGQQASEGARGVQVQSSRDDAQVIVQVINED